MDSDAGGSRTSHSIFGKWFGGKKENSSKEDEIKNIMSTVRGASLYWCMCDEEGDECETLHTHVFIFRSSPFTARQIDNLFPKMHRDNCYGTAADSRAYVLKDGEKFNKSPDGHYDYTDSSGKHHTGINYSDTFYEYGTCPDEHQGKSVSSLLIVDMIRDGASNRDIVEAVPNAYKELDKLDRARSMFRDSEFASKWRDLAVFCRDFAFRRGKIVIQFFVWERFCLLMWTALWSITKTICQSRL